MSPVVTLQPHGSRSPFFWVHGEKSNAVLANYLGPDQPLFAVLHQSYDGQRARFTRMEDIARHYLEGVRGIQPSGPYRLGGYCVGATLAFEMAQQLRRRGEDVALLVMLDPPVTGPSASPLSHIPPAGSRPDRSAPAALGASSFSNWAARQFRRMAQLGFREQLAYAGDGIIGRSRELLTKIAHQARLLRHSEHAAAGPGRVMRPEQRIRYINAVHYRAKRGYVPEVYRGRVVVLKTDGGCRDPELVWGPLAGSGLEVIDLPGRHTEIVVDDHQIEGLAKQLKACLEAADVGRATTN